jgi:tetratricopeptide (TPR) repeat protein
MSLNIESQSPQANAHLNLGVDELRRYQQSPENLAVLDEAEEDLNRAVKEDPAFLPAVYYRGLARDLKGETDLAISDLRRVVESNPPFESEAKFNLGVARFHKYHRADLEEAKAQFRAVLESKDVSKQLRLQTMASLAQVHAQLMIQNDPEHPNILEVKYNLLEVLKTEQEITALLDSQMPEPAILWRIENSLGLGNMFASDYCPEIAFKDSQTWSRVQMIIEARARFENADRVNPCNWAILCNLGSIWMRISYWSNRGELKLGSLDGFERSQHFLRLVIDNIRPSYGFALYELGRLHRVNQKFVEAREWFKRSEAVPEAKRDVGPVTLEREIKRAEARNPIFP